MHTHEPGTWGTILPVGGGYSALKLEMMDSSVLASAAVTHSPPLAPVMRTVLLSDIAVEL